MGNSYPGLATGGYDWFLDLSVADPTYILPGKCVGCMRTFLVCIYLQLVGTVQ